MSDNISQYDLPLREEAMRGGERLARELTKDSRRLLLVSTAATLVAGCALQLAAPKYLPLARSGAILTLISILSAYQAFRWAKVNRKAAKFAMDVYTRIERDKLPDEPKEQFDRQASATAKKRVERVLPHFHEAVLHTLIPTQLLIAALGTALWGFADLLPQ